MANWDWLSLPISNAKYLEIITAVSLSENFSIRYNIKFHKLLAPPLLYIFSCSVIIAPSSTSTYGYISLNSVMWAQWVEHFFPSSTPVSAKRKAPIHRLARLDPFWYKFLK